MIYLRADGRKATITKDLPITTGSVGLQVEVSLSEDYDGLASVVTFRAGTVVADVAYVGELVEVPPQVMTKPNTALLIGIYAQSADGRTVIPTVWDNAGIIQPGTLPEDFPQPDPAPSWAAQVQLWAQEAHETAEALAEDVSEWGVAEEGRVAAEQSRVTAESARAQAESGRASAETARVNAETARAQAETEREDAESVRSSLEAIRVQAESEREGAESARVEAESSRATAESARASAEAARANAESSRATAESQRAAAETARVNAEQVRAIAEEGRVLAEQGRVAAESARVEAESERESEWAALRTGVTSATSSANAAATAASEAESDLRAAAARGDFDGYSPTVAIASTDTEHTVTITDAQGDHSYTVPTYADEEAERAQEWDVLAQEAQDATDAANAAAAGITDANFPSLLAGSAASLTSADGSAASFMARTSPRDGTASIEAIRGRTLVWNQIIGNKTPTGTASMISILTKMGNAYVFNGTVSAAGNYYFWRNVHVVAGHKYLIGNIAEWSVDAGPNSGQANLMLYDKDNTALIGRTDAVGATIATAAATTDNADFYINVNRADVTLDGTIYPQLFDLTAMFGAGNEPSTVAEFEAMYPEPYYPYDAGSLLPVRMEGVESVGFNQWDEEWELGTINANNGTNIPNTATIRSKNHIPVFPGQTYYFRGRAYFWAYGADKSYVGRIDHIGIGGTSTVYNNTITIPNNVHYLRFVTPSDYGTTYNHDICINLSGPSNGTYEPYSRSVRTIPVETYFPDGMRSAGSIYDELTETQAVTRVEEFTFDGANYKPWISSTDGDYVVFGLTTSGTGNGIVSAQATTVGALTQLKAIPFGICTTGAQSRVYFTLSENETTAQQAMDYLAQHPITAHIAIATPVTTPIDPPLNLTYKAARGGTERITHTEHTAPPTLAVAYGYTAESLLDAAASMLADPDGPTATANHAVGSYLTMGGALYRVTRAIATGEAITPGTNVTATTVMAEVLSLIQ